MGGFLLSQEWRIPENLAMRGSGVRSRIYSPCNRSRTLPGKVATTKLFMPLAKGELENSWCLSEGDPSGKHHIVVLNDTQVLAEFEFVVYD